MKILIAYSGGKDSQAALIWTVKQSGFKKENIKAVFCDTGWENPQTYQHIIETTNDLGIELITLKSSKYKDFIGLIKSKGRFPSTKARFCTEELKTKPMIDYILDQVNDHIIVIQGIRADESINRSKMAKECTFFKYYKQPYGKDKNGNDKLFTYRKKEVLSWCKNYGDDILRPVIDWSANQVIDYILENNQKPNPLYYQGMKRVGCYPCIMTNHKEFNNIIKNDPDHINKLIKLETDLNSTFFPPKYIPNRYATSYDIKTRKKIITIPDVVKYLNNKNNDPELFENDDKNHRCMSFYNICE